MATEFYSYYDIPRTLPEFDWTKTTSQRTGWYDSHDNNRYSSGTVLQKKAYSVSNLPGHKVYKSIPWNDAEALKKYVLKTGAITEESAEEAGIDLDSLDDLNGVMGVFLSGNTDKKYSMASNSITRPNLNKLKQVQKFTDELDEVVKTLQDKGASDANIIDILSNKTFADADDITVFAKGIDSLPDNIAGALTDPDQRAALEALDIWGEISSSISATDSQSGDTWGGTASEEDGEGGATVSGGTSLNTQPTKSPVQVAEDQLNILTGGDPTSSEGLEPVLDDEGNPIDGEFTDAEGKTVTLQDGKYLYEDGTPYISPDQSTVATDIVDAGESRDAAQDVVDEAVQTTGQAVDTAAGIENAYLGGNVSPEAANALGWIKNPDGSFTDPSSPGTTYIIGDDGNLVDQADPTQAATTQGLINLDENDFAGQTETLINDFLYGAQVTPENAQEYGFSFNPETNTYISPDGTVYTNVGGQLQDENGVPIERSHGFTDYQSDLEGAAKEYTQQMTGLRGQYEQTFSEYERELNPYLQQQRDITSGLMDVARDAGDENYYGRLKDVYFADAAEGIQSDMDSSRDQVQQMYARSGADPNSPAYTAAIMDLQEKRGDAMRSARRQALLDSYSLGNNMLQNRSSTLANAQTGVGNSMNALGGLYDVKISGLEVDKDMISTIYQGKQNQASIGVQGLNTVAGQRQNIIDTNKDKFFKDLDIRTGLNQNTQNTATTAATTAGAADANATDDYWRGMGWLNTLVENDMDWRATGAAMQTQFPDYDFKGKLDPKLYNQLFPEGT